MGIQAQKSKHLQDFGVVDPKLGRMEHFVALATIQEKETRLGHLKLILDPGSRFGDPDSISMEVTIDGKT